MRRPSLPRGCAAAGIDLRRLRADVYDGTSDEPPAESDEDPDLLSVRGTAVLLAKWRQLAAAARLGVDSRRANSQPRPGPSAVTPGRGGGTG